MVTLNIGEMNLESRNEITLTLNEIACRIDEGYYSGITMEGVCWNIERYEEYQEEGDEEIFKIYHVNDEVENTFFPRGVYAHGDLERDMGYDLIRISDSFSKHINKDRYANVGEYKCSWRGCKCILIVRPEFKGAKTTNYGLICYEDDFESLDIIRRKFNELI